MSEHIFKPVSLRKYFLNFLPAIVTGLIIIHYFSSVIEWLPKSFFSTLSIIFIVVSAAVAWVKAVER